MIPIKLNGQSYNFPTEVAEISLKQFLALRRSNNLIDEICALTGMDRQTIQNFNSHADLEKCRLLLNTIGQKLATGFEGIKLPKQTIMDGKAIKVPRNLKLEPVGAFIAVHNLIMDEHKRCADNNEPFNPTDIIPQVLAQYFWQPYMGAGVLYSEERIEDEDYMEKIYTIPLTDAVPIANFFFSEVSKLVTEQTALLYRAPGPDELRAKAEKLNGFGWLLTIDTLAGFDITKWDEVLSQSYERTIIKLLVNRERMEYQKRYAESINAQ